MLLTGLWLGLATMVTLAHARPELVLHNDQRMVIEVAEFGFVPGGKLGLHLRDYKLSPMSAPGVAAFYVRKGRRPNDASDSTDDEKPATCLLDKAFISDEVNDGTSAVLALSESQTSWDTEMTVGPSEEGLWQVMFVNCKADTTASFRLAVDAVNPGNNHLSAGDMPLPLVYGISSAAYSLVAAYWLALLLRRQDTKVFRAHWLMLALAICITVSKALQSMKYSQMRTEELADGWRIGFYVFASLKGLLSVIILVLLASGWMFIKPFISRKDKRVISIVVPLQVLANVASAIGNEAAIGSAGWSFWNMVWPLIDLTGCGVVLWTILQTRKHLAAASSADGKNTHVLEKYKLWTSFYIVALAYIYVSRVIVQLLQATLPFRYVTWFGEAVNEFAALLFYTFIGYQFRPFPNNPYTHVPEDDHEADDAQNSDSETHQVSVQLQPVSPRV